MGVTEAGGGAQRLPPASRLRRGVLAGGAIVLVAAAVFVTASALASVPARLGMGCSRWVAVAAGLELLSAAGFVVILFGSPPVTGTDHTSWLVLNISRSFPSRLETKAIVRLSGEKAMALSS